MAGTRRSKSKGSGTTTRRGPSVTPKRKSGIPRGHRYVVIMAGGLGTRFWPWSRRDRPKQMLALSGRQSMLAETAERARRIAPTANILVVTGEHLGDAVLEAVPWLPPAAVLCEPEGRNTAACIGWAAVEVLARDADGVMAVLPADHAVSPIRRFVAAIEHALALAGAERRLVTFGVVPEEPATGYGYVRAGRPITGHAGAFEVRAFHEKPPLARARRFVASGDYYWNSGMFAWRADVILEAIGRHLPKLRKGLASLESLRGRGRIARGDLRRIYAKLPSISIDHGVMEHAAGVAMLAADFRWSDIGSWDAVGVLWPGDDAGNRSRDPVVAVDARDNVVATGGKPVALLGVDAMVVVDAGDALLVCPRDRAQDVREIVAALHAAGLDRLS